MDFVFILKIICLYGLFSYSDSQFRNMALYREEEVRSFEDVLGISSGP
jgi:hypothetical protein